MLTQKVLTANVISRNFFTLYSVADMRTLLLMGDIAGGLADQNLDILCVISNQIWNLLYSVHTKGGCMKYKQTTKRYCNRYQHLDSQAAT
jgi:hypothetical protein